jgi:hypothetical protein
MNCLKLFRRNLLLIAGIFIFALHSTGSFGMDEERGTPDVTMEESVAPSSILIEETAPATISEEESKALTKKITKLVNDSFSQNKLTLLEENKEAGKPAVVSPEMLLFLQKIEKSIPEALETGDKVFMQTTGYQEDLKIKLLTYLENFSKEFIPDLKDIEKKISEIKKNLEEKGTELSKLKSSEDSKDTHLPQKISAKRKELVKLLVELQDYSEDISSYIKDLNVSEEEMSTQKKLLNKSKKDQSINSLKIANEQIIDFEKQKKELETFLTKNEGDQIKELQGKTQNKIEALMTQVKDKEKGLPKEITDIENLPEKITAIEKNITETQAKIKGPKGDAKGKDALEKKISLFTNKLAALQDIAKEIKKLEDDKNSQEALTARAETVPTELNKLQHSIEGKKRDYNRELKNFYELGGTKEELVKPKKESQQIELPLSEYPLEMKEQERADSMVVNIRGKLYELQAALGAEGHGKKIQAFGQEMRLTFEKSSPIFAEITEHIMTDETDKDPNHFLSPEKSSTNTILLKQEFDLITDTEIIECKSTNWNIAQYIQNLNRQKFMIDSINDAIKIHIIDKNKNQQKISPEIAMQMFGNRSIICYVEYAAKPGQGGLKDLFEKGTYFQERRLIEQGFTLWNGEKYFHALTIKDQTSFKAPEVFKELIEKYKNLDKNQFILYIIERKKYHKLMLQRVEIIAGRSKKSLSDTASEKTPIHKMTPKESQEKLKNELKKILALDKKDELPFTVIFIDIEEATLKATGEEFKTPPSKPIKSLDLQNLRSKIRDTPPEETPSKKIARRIEGLSMGPKGTSEDQQPLPNNQGSPKPLGKVGKIRKNNHSAPLKKQPSDEEDVSTKKPRKSNFNSNDEDEAAR